MEKHWALINLVRSNEGVAFSLLSWLKVFCLYFGTDRKVSSWVIWTTSWTGARISDISLLVLCSRKFVQLLDIVRKLRYAINCWNCARVPCRKLFLADEWRISHRLSTGIDWFYTWARVGSFQLKAEVSPGRHPEHWIALSNLNHRGKGASKLHDNNLWLVPGYSLAFVSVSIISFQTIKRPFPCLFFIHPYEFRPIWLTLF